MIELTTILEHEHHEARIDCRGGENTKQNYFLLKVSFEKCDECVFKEEGGLPLLNCEGCIQKALEKSGLNVTVKQFDTSKYGIPREEIHITSRYKEKRNSKKVTLYEAWIIEQINSGNHKIIEKAQHGTLFIPTIKEMYVDTAFRNLEERNIIKKDATGKYSLVEKRRNAVEEEKQWKYYVSYPTLIDCDEIRWRDNKKFGTLEEAIAFVKTHNFIHYHIRRRDHSTVVSGKKLLTEEERKFLKPKNIDTQEQKQRKKLYLRLTELEKYYENVSDPQKLLEIRTRKKRLLPLKTSENIKKRLFCSVHPCGHDKK